MPNEPKDSFSLGLVMYGLGSIEEYQSMLKENATALYSFLGQLGLPVTLVSGVFLSEETLSFGQINTDTDLSTEENPTIWVGLGDPAQIPWTYSNLLRFASQVLEGMSSLPVCKTNEYSIRLLLICQPTSAYRLDSIAHVMESLCAEKAPTKLNFSADSELWQIYIPEWEIILTRPDFTEDEKVEERLAIAACRDIHAVNSPLINAMMRTLYYLCEESEVPLGDEQLLEQLRKDYLLPAKENK